MMKSNEALGNQRKLNDRDNMTGFRRADVFMQRVGSVICSILVLICMVSGLVKGISSIAGVISGKNNPQDNGGYNNQDNSNNGGRQRERHQNRW